jgi:hypothetical protein
LDVGTTPEGTAWFRAAAALQFARGFVNPEHAKNLLSKMLSEAVCLHRRAGMSGTGTDVLSALHRRAGMSGTGTAAEPDTNSVLEVEKIAEVDFGMNSGTRVGAVSVGTTSDGRVWLTAQDALQFACGGASDARAKQKLGGLMRSSLRPRVMCGIRDSSHKHMHTQYTHTQTHTRTRTHTHTHKYTHTPTPTQRSHPWPDLVCVWR